MSDFIYDKKESYSQDELERLLEQKAKFETKKVLSDREKEEQEKIQKTIQTEKEKWTNEIKIQKENEDFINSIPTDNQKIIKDMISLGKSTDEIKENYANLLIKPAELPTPDFNLNDIVNGEKGTNFGNLESDSDFKDRIDREGLDSKDTAGWKRFEEIKNKSKL